jgi:hypothetical protein
MKQMKRIMAMATAAAMTVGMFAMTASAEEVQYVTATPNEDGVVEQLPIKKVIDLGDKILPDMTLEFTMTPAEVEDGTKVDNMDVQAGPDLGDDGKVYITFNSGTEADANGQVSDTTNVSLTGDKIKELTTGVYRYNVQETIPTTTGNENEVDKVDGMVYDTTVYQVDLYVRQNDAKEGYVASVVAVKTSDTNTKVPIIFEDSLETYDVTISKVIEGDLAELENKAFDFYIQIPEGGDNIDLQKDTEISYTISEDGKDPITGTFLVEGNPVAKDAGISAVTFPESNAGEATNGLVGNFNHFTLKGGQTLTISGLPEGMIFYLAEADYSGEGYTTTVTYNFTGTQRGSNDTDASTRMVKGTVCNESNSVTFTNKKELVPNTGINVDFAPYLLVLMVAVVGGAAVLVFKKRRTVR